MSISDETVLKAARMALDIALALVPPDLARTLLDEQAVARANAVADQAERIKFGGTE